MLYTALHLALAVSCGFNLVRVLRIYVPGYARASFGRKTGLVIPVAIAFAVVIEWLRSAIFAWSHDGRGATILALLVGLSGLMWLRDLYPELDRE